MSFVTAAIVGGVASLGSAAIGAFGATSAAKTQAGAEQQALGLQQQQLTKLQPYETAGAGAANTLGTLTGANGAQPDYSSFSNSPDYQFAQQQGNLALQNYLNANGISRSGAGITSAINYNQGLASQQYGNYFNRLMQIATLGGNAAGAGIGGTNAAANTIGNIGASQASGIVGAANAGAGALGGIGNNALLYGALKAGQSPSGYAPITGGSPSPTAPVQYTGGPFQAGY